MPSSSSAGDQQLHFVSFVSYAATHAGRRSGNQECHEDGAKLVWAMAISVVSGSDLT